MASAVSFFFGRKLSFGEKKKQCGNKIQTPYYHNDWELKTELCLDLKNRMGTSDEEGREGLSSNGKSNFIRIPNSVKNRSLTAPYNFQCLILHKLLKTLEDIVSLRFI